MHSPVLLVTLVFALLCQHVFARGLPIQRRTNGDEPLLPVHDPPQRAVSSSSTSCTTSSSSTSSSSTSSSSTSSSSNSSSSTSSSSTSSSSTSSSSTSSSSSTTASSATTSGPTGPALASQWYLTPTAAVADAGSTHYWIPGGIWARTMLVSSDLANELTTCAAVVEQIDPIAFPNSAYVTLYDSTGQNLTTVRNQISSGASVQGRYSAFPVTFNSISYPVPSYNPIDFQLSINGQTVEVDQNPDKCRCDWALGKPWPQACVCFYPCDWVRPFGNPNLWDPKSGMSVVPTST